MREELIKRLRRAAARLDAPRYVSDAALLNEAADALSRPATAVQVPEGRQDNKTQWAKCEVCRGTGEWHSGTSITTRRCFTCKGAGRIPFTSTALAPAAPVAAEAGAQGGAVSAVIAAVMNWDTEWSRGIDADDREHLREIIAEALATDRKSQSVARNPRTTGVDHSERHLDMVAQGGGVDAESIYRNVYMTYIGDRTEVPHSDAVAAVRCAIRVTSALLTAAPAIANQGEGE